MASRAELLEETTKLATELGEEVVTEGLSNKALAELVDGLRARASAKNAPPAPPVQDGASDGSIGGPPPAVAPAPATQRFPFQVAAGKSITCFRGLLNEGDEIKIDDMAAKTDAARTEAMNVLVAKGYVTKHG
jgi:hypothetical protein